MENKADFEWDGGKFNLLNKVSGELTTAVRWEDGQQVIYEKCVPIVEITPSPLLPPPPSPAPPSLPSPSPSPVPPPSPSPAPSPSPSPSPSP